MLHLQQHAHGACSLLHGARARVRGVVARAHGLVRATLGTRLVMAERAPAASQPFVPQTLFPSAALDIIARFSLWKKNKKQTKYKPFYTDDDWTRGNRKNRKQMLCFGSTSHEAERDEHACCLTHAREVEVAHRKMTCTRLEIRETG